MQGQRLRRFPVRGKGLDKEVVADPGFQDLVVELAVHGNAARETQIVEGLGVFDLLQFFNNGLLEEGLDARGNVRLKLVEFIYRSRLGRA